MAFGNEVGLSMIAHLYNSDAALHGGQTEAIYNCKQKSEGRWVEDLERGIMPRIDPNPWQTDTSIGDWFYNRNWKFRPVSWVIHMLVDNVSKNGNLLLNVVQRPDGSLDPRSSRCSRSWPTGRPSTARRSSAPGPGWSTAKAPCKVKGGNFKEDFKYNAKDIRFTTKGATLYAIALGWPEDGQIVVRSLAKPAGENINNITAVSLLGYDGQISWKQTADGLVVTLPEKKVSEYTTGLKIIGTELEAGVVRRAGCHDPARSPRQPVAGCRRGRTARRRHQGRAARQDLEPRLLGQFQRLGLVESQTSPSRASTR